MNLPYTKVHVVFNENLCLPNHWAYAKIKTYSLQEKPFIHIDGDIYIPKPFPKEFLQAPLIAQNREIGTVYYREMMNRVFDHSGIRIPQFIVNGIREDSIASYNMGVFGGNDLEFIWDYCKKAFAFVEDNHLNDSSCPQSRVDCNLLFEQMFFAAQADMNNKKVAVLRRPMYDEGYTSRDFCNLTNFENAVIPVCPLGCRIIQLLAQNSIAYGEIKKRLRTCFSEKLRKQPKTLHKMFYQEIAYLFYYNILTTSTN